jgi:hypothetical protein
MGAMRPNQHFSKKIALKLRSIEVTQYFARSKFSDNFLSTILDANIGINEKTTIQFKLPYSFIWGRLPQNQGFADISLSLTRGFRLSEKYQLNATIGGKIPTNASNQASKDGLPYTMYYQTSLGSYDVVAGLSLISRNWLFAVGYQQPLNANKNQFLKTSWDNTPYAERARDYPNSKNIARGTDGMFRIERNLRFSQFNAHLGVLAIYRFNADIYEDTSGGRFAFSQTQGMTWNLLTGGGYQFSARTGIKLVIGIKIHERERNADGLSRDFVSTVGYEFRF